MANPFQFYPAPASAREHQSNANYWTYARAEAAERVQEWEREHPGKVVPCEVQADAHTARWVEREYARKAQQARQAEKAGRQ